MDIKRVAPSARPPRSLFRRLRRRPAIAHIQTLLISLIVDVLIVLVLVMLVWATLGVARDVWDAVTNHAALSFKTLSVEVLTVFIFIELFHSLTEYLRYQRIRITTLVDASLAFVLREVWMGLYDGHVTWQTILALSAMIIALGGVRTLAVIHSPSERSPESPEV